jgi:hypothetical protein
MLVPVACFALLAAAPDVESHSQLELRMRGDFAMASPGKPLRFKAAGPGKLVAYVLTRAGSNDDAPPYDLEVISVGASVFKDHGVASKLTDVFAQGRGADFPVSGVKRVTFDLLPKTRTYEFRVSAPTAIAVFRNVQAPPGVRVPEIPVRPEGKARPLVFAGRDKWHWASICDRVSVSLPQSGTLHVLARTGLADTADLPPPTFLRAVSDGKVRAAFPITSAPEPGLEFVNGGTHFGAGTVRSLDVPIATPGDYELEIAAWGCVNGVGLQLDFVSGTPADVAEANPLVGASGLGGTASAVQLGGTDGGASSEMSAQCGLQLDEMARARAVEYLDTMVASGVIPPSQLSLKQSTQIGDSFVVQSVWYALDGTVLFQKESPSEELAPFAQRRVVPGPHTLEVKATLRGRGSGPFTYLNDYVIKLTKREAFVAESGKHYRLKVTLFDKGGFSTPFKERPGLQVELVPES